MTRRKTARRFFSRWASWLAVGALLSGTVGCATASAAPVPGHTAPDFSLHELGQSRVVRLQDLLSKHEPVVLNIWASWCGPCKAETPDLVAEAKAYSGRVLVVGINGTAVDKISDVEDFVTKYQLPYPVLLDEKGTFINTYQILGFPTTFLISPNGRVVKLVKGPMTKSEMAAFFKAASQLN